MYRLDCKCRMLSADLKYRLLGIKNRVVEYKYHQNSIKIQPQRNEILVSVHEGLIT